ARAGGPRAGAGAPASLFGDLGGEATTVVDELREACPRGLDPLATLAFEFLLQVAQFGHALDRLGLVLVEAGLMKVLQQLRQPGLDATAVAAAEGFQQLLDSHPNGIDLRPRRGAGRR